MKNSYEICVKGSEKVAWILDEVLPMNSQFDLTKQFIPMSAANGINELSAFAPQEVLLISQLHASAYTYLIHIVEEYIVDIVTKQFAEEKKLTADRARAMSRFLDEEIKHQQMFERFNILYQNQTQQKIIVQNNGSDFSKKVLGHSPLSIWLLTLHTELMTHFHYSDIFKHNTHIEPKFLELLRLHWLEESVHVKIDNLEIQNIIANCSESELKLAAEDYIKLLKCVDDELHTSAQIQIDNFKNISGNNLDSAKETKLKNFLIRILRNFMIYSGLKHPTLVESIKLMNIGLESRLVTIPHVIESKLSSKAG